jgi:hypothetical protein
MNKKCEVVDFLVFSTNLENMNASIGFFFSDSPWVMAATGHSFCVAGRRQLGSAHSL